MSDVASDLKNWSTTAASNSPSGSTAVGAGLDDNLREIQKVVRQDLANKGADIASAATTDLGAVAGVMHDITGTTTITSLETVSAGIWKILQFDSALTLTHNSTSLVLPGGANITTATGDVALFISEGSGNWRCISYVRAEAQPVANKAVAKAWVNFTGTGTVTINGSYNVTSITDNGTGDYTVNFTNAFANANYAFTVACGDNGTGGSVALAIAPNTSAMTASAFRFTTRNISGTPTDAERVSLVFFGV